MPLGNVIKTYTRHYLHKSCILPYMAEKLYEYGAPNHVLISRNENLIERWKQAGGIGIRYKSATQTYNQVKALIGEQNPIPF